jgi:EmrB/QacA subfamily drug resistance transporter
MAIHENRKWWVLGALSFGLLAVGLDMTVLNVALPTLAVDLHASTGQLQWFANAYNLVLAAALLPAGMLGDRYGRKKFLLLALVLFGAASLGCAYADTSEMLIVMRAALGLGAAFLIPLSMSALPVLFAEKERTKATTIWASANMLGIPLGPIVGGWLLKHYAWGSVFLINLPFVAVALIAVTALMPESRSADRPRLDPIGIATSSAGLAGVTYGVTRIGEQGWEDAPAWIALGAGLLILAAFVLWQKRTSHPLIDLSLFGSMRFTWGALLATLANFAIFGLLFALPQFLQAVGNVDTFGTGLRLLPLIGGLIVGAKASDRLISVIGSKLNAAAGFAVIAAGLLIGTATDAQSGYGYVAVWISVTGVGLGLALPTTMDAALGVLSAERSGVGSALIMALRQVGGVIGVAILGSTLNYNYRHGLHLDGLPDAVAGTVRQSVTAGVAVARKLHSQPLLDTVVHAFVHGMATMLWVCGGIAILGTFLTLIFLPRHAHRPETGHAKDA